MIGKVYPSPPPRVAEVAEEAGRLGVATIAAAMPEPTGRDSILPKGVLGRLNGEGAVAGSAVTIWSPPGNNTMIRFGIEQSVPGDVLVLVCPTCGVAQWGELATAWALARGVVGVLVFGSVRDVAGIRETPLSIWATDIDPRESYKESLGYVNAPVNAAGRTIAPGDLIVADDDAVMSLAPDDARKAIRLATARAEREQEILRDAQSGVRSQLLPPLPTEGIEIADAPWAPPAADPIARG